MKKIIIIVLFLSIILSFLYWKFGPKIPFLNASKPQGPVSLTFWGLWEDDNLIKPVITQYQQQNPLVTVTYVRQSSVNYRTRVQTQVREGIGPDIFMIHNSWLPMFTGDLQPSPSEVFNIGEYKKMFYPVAADSFILGNDILGAPQEVDGLALFINEDILNGVGGQPPKNWQEFINLATKMTVKDSGGQIKTAGAALGTTANVDHWSDVIGLLLLQQPNVDLKNLVTPYAAEVFSFYTGFVTDPRRKSWDVTLPNSTTAFAQGRVGFYFAPSWRAHELRLLNPNLKFKIVPVPQLSNKQVGWASFWGMAVSAKSNNPKEAWNFIKFMTSVESEKLAYQEAAKIRLFGQPYSQVNLASEIAQDPIVGAFVSQGPKYKFWYLESNTMDGGLNDEMIKYFEDGINATLQGQNPLNALQTVDQGVKQVLDKYTKPQPAPSSR